MYDSAVATSTKWSGTDVS